MKKLLALILAMSMVVISLSACSSSGDASSTDTSSSEASADSSSEESSETPESSAEASAVSETLADGVLTVGTNAEFPPFEYVGDDGEPDGFDIALIKAIGEKLGVEVEVQNMEFNSLIASIGSRLDCAIAGMTVTDERKESVDFSDNYYEAVQYVIVPKDSDIKTMEDLEGKTIGCQIGTTGDFLIEDIEGATAQEYDTAPMAVQDLVAGRVDCVIIDKNPAEEFVSQYPDDLAALPGTDFGFETEYYAIAMPKGDSALVDAVNQALQELKDDGTYDELVKQYIEGE